MTNGNNGDDDDFKVHSSKQKTKPKSSRVYIGNLRNSPGLASKLEQLLQENGFRVTQQDITIQKSISSCYALVLCQSSVDRVISKLNGVHFDGRKLVVQREQQKKGGAINHKKPPFGGGGWTAPKPVVQKAAPKPVTVSATDNSATKNEPAAISDEKGEVLEDEITFDDFRNRCQKPLSDLMEEFGEYDPDFMKVVPCSTGPDEEEEEEETAADQATEDSNPRLGKFGKVPIHVEFRSFGYVFGAPSSKGWSHSQPLPPLDCRDLPQVPPWMVRQDGKSPAVKRMLMNDDSKSFANSVADQAMDALVEAMADGHGHAMPLRMTIHVGSEHGRHRSVAVCEESARGLRTRLRRNTGNRIQQDVSVGTAHQDIDRKRDSNREKTNWSNKTGEFGDEW